MLAPYQHAPHHGQLEMANAGAVSAATHPSAALVRGVGRSVAVYYSKRDKVKREMWKFGVVVASSAMLASCSNIEQAAIADVQRYEVLSLLRLAARV